LAWILFSAYLNFKDLETATRMLDGVVRMMLCKSVEGKRLISLLSLDAYPALPHRFASRRRG
jgi:hypothetical protein